MTLQFQSTLGYLKAPPVGYQQPPFDFNQALEEIKQNVTRAVYKNQYEFEAQLQLLVHQLRDTHVILNAGALSAFSFVGSFVRSLGIGGV
jgi:3-dehydroquinate dehydratase